MQAQDDFGLSVANERAVGRWDFPVGQPRIAFDSNRDITDADCKTSWYWHAAPGINEGLRCLGGSIYQDPGAEQGSAPPSPLQPKTEGPASEPVLQKPRTAVLASNLIFFISGLLYFFFFLSIDLTPGLFEISGVPPQADRWPEKFTRLKRAAGLIEKKRIVHRGLRPIGLRPGGSYAEAKYTAEHLKSQLIPESNQWIKRRKNTANPI